MQAISSVIVKKIKTNRKKLKLFGKFQNKIKNKRFVLTYLQKSEKMTKEEIFAEKVLNN